MIRAMTVVVIILLGISAAQWYAIQVMGSAVIIKEFEYEKLLKKSIEEQQRMCVASSINHLSDSDVDSELHKQGWVEDTE